MFPGIDHLDIKAARLSFGYAQGTELHRTIAAGWSYEQDVMATLLTCLSGDDEAIFIDVGANIGYFPIVVRKLLGERVKCIAYEPAPDLVATIHRGCGRNNVELDVREAAVGKESGTATFYLSARSDASNSLNPRFRKHRGEIEVRVTTLDDDILPSLPKMLPTRPILLVDTETTEPDVLVGAKQFIRTHRPAVICEVLADRTEVAIQDFVERSSYHAYSLTDAGPQLREEVVGDITYAHRDWLLWPSESSPPIDSIRRTLGELQRHTE